MLNSYYCIDPELANGDIAGYPSKLYSYHLGHIGISVDTASYNLGSGIVVRKDCFCTSSNNAVSWVYPRRVVTFCTHGTLACILLLIGILEVTGSR